MKKSGLLKALAAIFLFFSIVITALASITVYIVFESGSNYDGGTKLTLDIAEEISAIYANEILSHYLALESGSVSSGNIQAFTHQYSEENTNIRFKVTKSYGNVLYNSLGNSANESMLVVYETNDFVDRITNAEKHEMSFTDRELVEKFKQEIEKNYYIWSWNVVENANAKYLKYTVIYEVSTIKPVNIKVEAGIPLKLQAVDYLYWLFAYVTFSSMYYAWVIAIGVLSIIIAILCTVYICSSAGHRRKKEDIHLGFFARLPIELYLLVLSVVGGGCVYLLEEFADSIALVAVSVIIIVSFIGFLFSISARLKSKGWYKNSIILKILSLISRWALKPIGKLLINGMIIIAKINLYWKTAFVSICFFVLYLMAANRFHYGGLWFIIALFLVQLILSGKFVLDLKKLEKTGAEISCGSSNAKIDKKSLLPSLRKHAESLNNIGEGIDEAVNRSIKSERMKTELITNVSHDIKTPLTSIINYVGLLKQEGLSSDSAPEYLEVLDRQSQRLKKMTEDLVEASKAASGNINVEAENTDINIILSQALGEYEEKLSARKLSVVIRKEDGVNSVYADGKLLWRIYDNLLSNVCKYALSGTRVYVDMRNEGDRVLTVFKNVSAEPLEHTSEELMERFVRGDSSRNTEGSGLGLSIAKSLAELQEGSFSIETDGDLFKAALSLPIGK